MSTRSELIVIKFGGEIITDPTSLSNLASSIAQLFAHNFQIVLVHGGGPIATKLGAKLGVKSTMVGGRRITCPKSLEIMKMTLPGVINSNILAALKATSLPSVAVSAISYIDAIKRPPRKVSGSKGKIIDFGAVGDVVKVDPTYINSLTAAGYIPVVSPLCADNEGNILNINADTIAVKTAQAIKATRFVLITKVGGVFEDLDDLTSRLPLLTQQSAYEMIENGKIQGGMIPKLEESFTLLQKQLKVFHITGVNSKDSLNEEIHNPGSQGTAVTS